MIPTSALMSPLQRQLMMAPGAPTAQGLSPMMAQRGGLGGLVQNIKNRPNPNDVHLPYFEEDRRFIGDQLAGRSPFASGGWDPAINRLEGMASGTAPSLAEMQYRSASMDTTSALSSMARGSASPAAARQAMIQQGRVGQGMAAGVAQARTNEQMQANNALIQALGSRDQLNQNAYLDMLAAKLGLSRAELEALSGNKDREAQKKIADKQASAAKWGAIAGGAGALAGMI